MTNPMLNPYKSVKKTIIEIKLAVIVIRNRLFIIIEKRNFNVDNILTLVNIHTIGDVFELLRK